MTQLVTPCFDSDRITLVDCFYSESSFSAVKGKFPALGSAEEKRKASAFVLERCVHVTPGAARSLFGGLWRFVVYR
jgi:hypothetical protein